MLRKIGPFLVACVAFVAGAAIFPAAQQNRPGDVIPPRVWIENRSATDAIPVVVQDAAKPMPVQLIAMPSVHVASAATIPTRAVRESWEYRTLSVPSGQDAAGLLAAPGNDGWEAVGVLPSTQAGAVLLLKRPR